MKVCTIVLCILALTTITCLSISTSSFAATIQYIGSGKKEGSVEISFSRNNGSTWQSAKVAPGQTLAVPSDATHLNIQNTPRDPRRNYKIREGNIFRCFLQCLQNNSSPKRWLSCNDL